VDGVVTRSEVLAIIPARGGSKSIPRKNVRLFAGHPLIAYSIAAARQASSVTRVIVSTDDEEIAAVGRTYGAETPFMRPAELAQDLTQDLPVFEHALSWLAEHEQYRADVVVQLRPTSPIRPRDCVDQAIALLLARPEADSVRGVVPSGQNPYKMWRLLPGGRMTPLLSGALREPYNMPRQELPPTHWQTGHVDAIRARAIREQRSMSGQYVMGLEIDPRFAVDIDTDSDWDWAERVFADSRLDAVRLGPAPRALPDDVRLVVLDFDGVMTDNRVWTDAEGRETVAADRSDGWGLARLRERGVDVVVLSTETNPVVAARCRKLNLPYVQGSTDKAQSLRTLLDECRVDPAHVIYLGNDANDIPCFPMVACAFVVADAHPSALAAADRLLSRPGGHGAVRELCDMLIAQRGSKERHGR
jgi:YrbI family 3-deoxy-D-manno-octulosonate 8-phosphate phosphatase